MRVAILGIPCSPMLCTPEALGVVGPAAFKYDAEYCRLEGYKPVPLYRGTE